MEIRVAIVEDNRELREGLTQLVACTAGMICVGAFPNCEEMLSKVAEVDPDVVLMDIGLPGMSGIEGLRRLKSVQPKVSVVMLTVYEDEARIFESICTGACGYLLKKTPPAKILEAITDIHNGGAPMTPKIARRVLARFQQPPDPGMGSLSERERDVLHALVEGLSYKMIADRYSISIDTVRSHIKKVYDKLHVHSKSEAVARALKSGAVR